MMLMQLFNAAASMEALARFSMINLAAPENVLTHTGFVCLASMLITKELNTVGAPLDIGAVLVKAVVHDMEELITGDLPRPTKYQSKETEEMFNAMKPRAMSQVLRHLGCSKATSDDLQLMHHNAKQDRTGTVIALVDAMAIIYKIWTEVLVRNNHAMVAQAKRQAPFLNRIKAQVRENFIDDEAQQFYLLSLIEEMYALLEYAIKHDSKLLPIAQYGTL